MSDLSASLLGMPHHGADWSDFGRFGVAADGAGSAAAAPAAARDATGDATGGAAGSSAHRSES